MRTTVIPPEIQGKIAKHLSKRSREQAFGKDACRYSEGEIDTLMKDMQPIRDSIINVLECLNSKLDANKFELNSFFHSIDIVAENILSKWPSYWKSSSWCFYPDGDDSDHSQTWNHLKTIDKDLVESIRDIRPCCWTSHRMYDHTIRVQLGEHNEWRYVLEIGELYNHIEFNDEDSFRRTFEFVMEHRQIHSLRYRFGFEMERTEYPSDFVLDMSNSGTGRSQDYLPIVVFLRTILKTQEDEPYLDMYAKCKTTYCKGIIDDIVEDCQDCGLRI
jgi:hypothetical protein